MNKKKLLFSASLTLLGLVFTSVLHAQTGTTGNTITFDATNGVGLKSNNGASVWRSYVRHNQAPIQIINANPNANSNSIAPLQEADGNGMFANTSIANNMVFSTSEGKLEFYNYKNNYDGAVFAIMAPRGYRFTEYYMDIRGTQASDKAAANSGCSGATISRYTYVEGTTYQYKVQESQTLTSDNSQIFTHTLGDGGNILYFLVQFTNSSTQWCLHLNELRLTYVIAEEFEAEVPVNGEAKVSTGILNLGTFATNTNGSYFDKTNVTDMEDVYIMSENGSAEMSVADGFINVPEGTYYIESPAKYRITGATMNFAHVVGSTSTSYVNHGTNLASILGKKVKIGNGSDNYLRVTADGSAATYTTDVTLATTWIITNVSDNTYYIQTETGSYLYRNNSGSLTTGSDTFAWTYYENYSSTSQTSTCCFICNNGTRDYGIRCYNNQWAASRTDRTDSQYTPTPLYYYEEKTTSIDGDGTYTATLYAANGTDAAGTVEITEENPTGSATATDLNNDAVKFSVTGSAGFTIALTFAPLDPTVQTVDVGYYSASQGDVTSTVPVSAANFKFNEGEDIVIPILPDDKDQQNKIVFRNAYNENRTAWYDGTALGNGQVNYFLVGSAYEINGSETTAPDDKVNADQAGTVQVKFSNVDELVAGTATEYKEYDFEKSNAGYQDVMMGSNDSKTVYIYSGDRPEYCIMTAAGLNQNKHVAYTFYSANLKTTAVTVEPVVTITKLYDKTLKGQNNKVATYNSTLGKSASVDRDNAIDESHTFYGVKVTASNPTYGYLSNGEVIKAIEDGMKTQTGVYTDDWFRTILYVDMSELKSVSASVADGEYSWNHLMLGSADNCLFFMPQGFNYVSNNIVAGGEGGRSTGDVVIYDQQPFFSPYNFYTGTRVARYDRQVVNEKHSAYKKTTLVMPFAIPLDDKGHLKVAADKVDESVTFYNLTGVGAYGDDEQPDVKPLGAAYKITSEAVAGGTAAANTPFFVEALNANEEEPLSISISGTSVAQTPATQPLTVENGTMKAYGSYTGQVAQGDDYLYFSKEYFWSTNTLASKTVKVLPYRAYYTSTPAVSTFTTQGQFYVVPGEDGGETLGIETVAPADGTSADAVYDLQGRRLPSQTSLPRGIYIVSGKKIFVK